MERHGELTEIDVVSCVDHFFYRPRFNGYQRAWRLAQPIGERGQKFIRGDTERSALRPAVLDQDVAHAEIWILDNVFEQDRVFALRCKRADMIDAHRL